MEEFWILILVLFFVINSMDEAKSVQLEELEELPLQTFDELFVEQWLDRDEAEDLKTPAPTNFGQIEPNSTDQNPPLTESDHFGQIEPNSTDQNIPLTESDHSDNVKNSKEQNEITSNKNIAEDERKRKIVAKFHAIKDEFKQKEKFSAKEWIQIEYRIAKHLKVCRQKIYKWKKEFDLSRKTGPNFSDDEKLKIVKKLMQMKSEHSGEDKKSCKEIDKEIAERFGVSVRKINRWKKEFSLSRRSNPKNERKNLVKKFDLRKAELMRDGFKNSQKEINETAAKELGLNFKTIYKWKSDFGLTKPTHKYSHKEQKEMMKRYYQIKDQNPEFSVGNIAKMLKIGRVTLYKWKKQFKRQQLHPNFENFGPEGLFD